MALNSQYLYVILMLIISSTSFSKAQQFLDKTMVFDGETRTYKIYVPSNYNGSIPFPLLFNFHGGGGNIASQVAIADMRPIADTANFFVVYPQALPDPGDGGSANWLHKAPTTVDDVFFVDAMINSLTSQYEINATQIYACGYSLGGEFTYELACRLNHKIAAVGIVARTMGTAAFENCSPVHPTGIMTILGTDDFISPYEGLEWNGIQYYLSADQTHNYWVDHNNADLQPLISQLPNHDPSDGSTVEHFLWTNGDGCAAVEHLKINGGGHDWPGSFGNMDIDASIEIWNFVSKYNLDGVIDCATTSIYEELSDTKKTIIYPNPASNKLIIEDFSGNNKLFKILNLHGKQVLMGSMDTNITTIDLSNLSPNSYTLVVDEMVFRFVKQ